MENLAARLAGIVGQKDVLTGEAIAEDYCHDEALTAEPQTPGFVVRPSTTEQVAGILRLANEHGVPVTVRGKGTGLCGACVASAGGILLSTERMNRILEIDAVNHVAVVEPGVTLTELDEATAEHGLAYPILPGESSASLGGNVATNAGGMHAVRYGVTRNQVLGLEAVLATGEVIRTGGKIVKSSTGYDLTQLIVGSEGTLAVVTRVILRLVPRLRHNATLLAPFGSIREVTEAVPKILGTGILPLVLEYIDMFTMAAITQLDHLELGIPKEVRDTAMAYLLIVLEARSEETVQQDVEELGGRLVEFGAMDVFMLPSGASRTLIKAREHAFEVVKTSAASDILDTVVPRASIATFMDKVRQIGEAKGSPMFGGGHAGDGNIHLAVYQKDHRIKAEAMLEVIRAAVELGGTISAEHGIGTEKKPYLASLEDPVKIALMKRIKSAFDPKGILNPGKIFD